MKKSFKEKVLDVVRKIPKGQVLTYKQVAKKAGNEKAARVVGNLMKSNFDKNVPCHRVIRSDGKVGDYNRGGAKKKEEILRREGLESIKIIPAKNFPDQKNLIQKLIAIDYFCYGEIDLRDEGSKEYWEKINKGSFCFLAVKDEKPIGYFDFMALNSLGLEKLLKGKLREGEMEGLIDFEQKGNLNLYLVSLVLLKEFRGLGLSRKIWDFALSYFKEQNINIENIYGTLWSEDGERFAKKYNYKVVAYDVEGRKIVSMI